MKKSEVENLVALSLKKNGNGYQWRRGTAQKLRKPIIGKGEERNPRGKD